MRARLGTRVVVACVLSLAAVACGNKKKRGPAALPPEVTGLAAVPATAQVLIAADVGQLAGSPIVARAVDQLLLRDPSLAERWEQVREGCKLDLPAQIKHVMLAVGPASGGSTAGPVLMVATGALSEPDLASCIRGLVGKGGGGLTATTVEGRALYQVQDGNRTMFFAFSRPDTVVLGTSDAWVRDALGTGKKALDNADLAGWLALADQRAAVWAVGRIDERVRKGLVGASGGKLAAGPIAIVAAIDPREGARLDVGAVMSSADEAKRLESFVTSELQVLTMVAQLKSLGPVVSKVAVATEGPVVRLRAPLTIDEVNQLLSVLDENPAPEQGTPPPQGSGSEPGPQ